MKLHVVGFALFSLTAFVGGAPAQAQNGTLTRSFVSSSGVDSNPCTITQPCASFAAVDDPKGDIYRSCQGEAFAHDCKMIPALFTAETYRIL